MLNRQNFYRHFRHNSRGFSIIEVLVALVLLGIIAVAFLGALFTASKASFIDDERATAESLARCEIEYVRNQDYDISVAPWSYELPSNPPSWDESHALPEGYDGYTASVSAVPLHDTDDGIQKITVVIYHHENIVITLESYRAVR